MADDDLDYSDTNVGSAQSQGVRKNISLKLKGKSRSGRGKRGGRGRRATSSKKIVIGSNEDDDEETPTIEDPTPGDIPTDKQISDIGLDEVICKLETPSFSPMDRAFPEPLHQNKPLRWNHKVNLIGEKVVNPLIHRCEQCGFPILNYGRMIPCKHIFCYGCAKKADKICPKCSDKVQRVEQTSLGTVFMCTFGGSRLGPVACGRTYLSQRDLQAHINHRHLKPPSTSASTVSTQPSTSHSSSSSSMSATAHIPLARDPRDPRGHISMDGPHSTAVVSHSQHGHGLPDHREQSDHPLINSAMSAAAIPAGNQSNQSRQYPHSPANYPSVVPVSSARPNLITVPIQDDSSGGTGQHVHSQQPHTPQYTPPGSTASHPPPPIQHPASSYPPPPPHPYQHPIPAPAPAYSQAPPMTTQTFTAHPPPPSVHHPPPMHATNAPGSMYSTPPPVHHPPPPVTYSGPQGSAPPHSSHTLPPQRFTNPGAYDEPYNIQPWNASNVPPPTRGPLPPRPIAAPPSAGNHPHIPSRGPSDPNFRPQYYQ